MSYKECIVYNWKKNIIRLKLRDILSKGLKVLKNNKRALKW